MPLVLGLSCGQGFTVGDHKFTITEVYDDNAFDMESPTGKHIAVSETCSHEVLKNVFVSAGDRSDGKIARVVIDAPREVIISRVTNNYRNPYITTEALGDMGGYGYTSKEAKEYLKQACRLSAPVTSEFGDFRYEDFILDIQEDRLLGVYSI